jgi:hypothetical protein
VSKRKPQRDRLLGLFISARGREISLSEILTLNIAQFGARILELRRLGFRIVNRTEISDGKKLSWYRLDHSQIPALTAPNATDKITEPTNSLFGDLTPDRSYRE